uniref:Uncharacterized protein n=1 Tax=Anguilla anguilla TaxID=7936 RepID=A0A0E9XE71_ANGAN
MTSGCTLDWASSGMLSLDVGGRGRKLTILFSLTIKQGFPSLNPKVGSSRPEHLSSQDLLKIQAFLIPWLLSSSPRLM